MDESIKVLLVEDDKVDQLAFLRLVEREGLPYKTSVAGSVDEARAILKGQAFDIALVDYLLGGGTAFDLFDALGDTPSVIITGNGGEEIAVRALKAGVKDYLVKDPEGNYLTLLPVVVENVLVRKRTDDELRQHREHLERLVEERTAELKRVNQDLSREISERKRAEERIQHQLERISALRTVDMAILASLDIKITLGIILEQVTALLGVDAAHILLYNPGMLMLETAARRGFKTDALRHSRLRIGQSYAGQAAQGRHVVRIADLPSMGEELFAHSPAIRKEGFVAYYAIPLIAKGALKGVLEVFQRTRVEVDEEWLAFLEMLAGQAAITIDNATLFTDLQRANTELVLAYDATLEGWSRALELRDHGTEGHTQRVTEMTLQLALAMGFSREELNDVRRGALLHDIGKVGIPDSILLKPGPLSENEWDVMRQHPVHAYKMLSPIPFLQDALDIPHYHHEKWDGSGYPEGLSGDEIPLEARIFAVVDVWDALLSDRPYREAWLEADVNRYVREQSGKHFDPEVVDTFMQLTHASTGAFGGGYFGD